MATTTFSGPIKAGTVKENGGINLGNVVLSQSYDSGDLTGDATGNYDVQLGTLPAGSQIVDIVVDQVVAEDNLHLAEQHLLVKEVMVVQELEIILAQAAVELEQLVKMLKLMEEETEVLA